MAFNLFAPIRSDSPTRLLGVSLTALIFAAPIALAQPTAITYTDYASQAGLDDALRLVAPSGRYSIMSGGGVTGDFNNDGFDDIFMLAGGGYADYFYVNNQDGTFTNNANDWGVDHAHHSFGASAADFNNDATSTSSSRPTALHPKESKRASFDSIGTTAPTRTVIGRSQT